MIHYRPAESEKVEQWESRRGENRDSLRGLEEVSESEAANDSQPEKQG